ncbi:MAG: CoA transferase subunit A [Mycobacteriaceae bacterium]|nr:CoA transferase subunit A [Mycobacteriaceae bacterium]
MRDKRTTLDEAVAGVESGMTIGIGGWGSRRKPMAFVRALLRRGVTDLTVVTYGGPDIGLLCSADRVTKVYYGFVSLGLPFLPIRAGLGSSVPDFFDGELKTVRSPYPTGADGHEDLIAMPALRLDAAFVHLNMGDRYGNAAYTGIDPYFDDLFLMAAERRYLSVERVVGTEELVSAVAPQALLVNRMMVDHVVEAPGGAHFTTAAPDYGRDESFQQHYAQAAADEASWAQFVDTYLSGGEADYQAAVRRFADRMPS